MNDYTAAAVTNGTAIGSKALVLLFVWLISAAAASWLSDRKGYGERTGLTLGLLLTAVGLLIVLLLPSRPGSKWRTAPASPAAPFEHLSDAGPRAAANSAIKRRPTSSPPPTSLPTRSIPGTGVYDTGASLIGLHPGAMGEGGL